MGAPTKRLQILGSFNAGLPDISASSNKLLYVKDGELQTISVEAFVKNEFKFTSCKATPSQAEYGSTVDSVVLSWVLNMTPSTVTVNNKVAVDPVAEGSYTITGIEFTDNYSWPISATNESDETASGTASLTFLKGVYYGVLTDGVTIDSAAILSLTRKLQSNKTITFAATAGENQRFTFALPSSGYGTPTFNIGGFDYTWTKTTISFTNASGHTEDYDVWQHPQIIVGSKTVKVS